MNRGISCPNDGQLSDFSATVHRRRFPARFVKLVRTYRKHATDLYSSPEYLPFLFPHVVASCFYPGFLLSRNLRQIFIYNRTVRGCRQTKGIKILYSTSTINHQLRYDAAQRNVIITPRSTSIMPLYFALMKWNELDSLLIMYFWSFKFIIRRI